MTDELKPLAWLVTAGPKRYLTEVEALADSWRGYKGAVITPLYAQPERKLTDAEIFAFADAHMKWVQPEHALFYDDDLLQFARALLAAQPASNSVIRDFRTTDDHSGDANDMMPLPLMPERVVDQLMPAGLLWDNAATFAKLHEFAVNVQMEFIARLPRANAAQTACHDCRVSPDGVHQDHCPEAAAQEHDFNAMVEKGTKAWTGTPDNWLEELRGNDAPAAQAQDDGEKQ